MYELIQVGERTYYVNCPVKLGIYKLNDTQVCLIDSGIDKDIAKKLQKILDSNGWSLEMIINTHSHADHIGGNSLLQDRLKVKAYSTGIEKAFIESPILEPSFLYGGYPFKELRNKFLVAPSSSVSEIEDITLPDGLEYIRLDGHSFAMLGIKTSDNVLFIADSITGENILDKYHISFLYDVKGYLNSLDVLESIDAKLFIPAHAQVLENIRPLAQANRNKVNEIINTILEICDEPICFEDILKKMFDRYELVMDVNQYVLVGSTLRSYLSYLKDAGSLNFKIEDNRLLWYA